MYNRSELAANQFLTSQTKRYNKKLDRTNTISGLAVVVLIFGAIGYLLAVAYFAG